MIVTIMDEFIDGKYVDEQDNSPRKSAAFARLEAWREKNKGVLGADFDWQREVREAINEKYAGNNF